MTSQFSLDWSRHIGLANTPLFEAGEISHPDQHAVLLDGGNGSFILSQLDETSEPRQAASWAWSAGLTHHVAVVGDAVLVTKWDSPQTAEKFTLRSVSEKLEAFYNYLTHQRISGRRDVVATLIDLFRAVRGEVEAVGASDDTTVAEFLDVLAQLVASERNKAEHRPSFAQVWNEMRSSAEHESILAAGQKEKLEVGFKSQVSSLLDLQFSAVLAVRHAASAIFQEAHYTFRSSDQANLFGYQPTSAQQGITRGPHHFTPPSLARSIVEQALAAIPNVERRSTFVACDPACGSGAFLTETARTLRRMGFNGKLRLVGRDLSQSAALMARFALHAAKFDWQPSGGIEIDVQVADALTQPDALPPADLIVMNPPFLAWPMMDKERREIVSQILGSSAKHRPDLSMSFVTRALDAVNKGGVVASLVPMSVLALDSAKAWRDDLLSRSHLTFLGSFGEYGLFVHALVQVAAIVLVSGSKETTGVALTSANETTATGEALRALRRLAGPVIAGASGKGWRITSINQRDLIKTNRWRILPAAVEDCLARLDDLGMPRVGELFDVKQGILTGMNDAFILTRQQLETLREPERRFFRPALFRNAITEGRVQDRYYVFFPYDSTGPIFEDEEDVRTQVPEYFRHYLEPREAQLRKRSGVDDAAKPWWSLSRYYKWVERSEARILTKYFGTVGDFVVDENARYVPLHGYAWFFRGHRGRSMAIDVALVQILKGYYTLLNSSTFGRLLKVFSDPVAGGQFNLSVRFVRPIRIINLAAVEHADLATDLAQLATATDVLSPSWLLRSDELCARAWGPELVSALSEMDDA